MVAWMKSRYFLLGVGVSLVLVFLLAMALVPWMGTLVQPDHSQKGDLHKSVSQHGGTPQSVTSAESQAGHSHSQLDSSHIGSPIASGNYRDIGYLQRNSAGQRDRSILQHVAARVNR